MKTQKRCLCLSLIMACCFLFFPPLYSQSAASLTCYGDLNMDGDVDGHDLTEFLAEQNRDMETFASNYGLADCTNGSDDQVTITYSGNSVSVENPFADLGVTVAVTDAEVIVTSTAGLTDIAYSLSGTTSDGMFKIYSDCDFTLQLNGVTITNQDGPAINIQADVTISVELVDGTTTTLTDGTTYTAPPDDEDQKAAFFSEGQMLFSGTGSLVVYGQGDDQHGLDSDNYIEVKSGTISIASSTKDGIHTNEGFYQVDGSVHVTAGSDGIDAGDGPVELSGGDLTVLIEDDDRDGIKCDGDVTISGGEIELTVNGDQSKGINAGAVQLTGGSVVIDTSGGVVLEESGSGYDPSYCTAIKTDDDVVLNGSEMTITTSGEAGRGISSDGAILIYSGLMTVTSTGNGNTYTDETGATDAYHGPCMKADGDIIIKGGTVTVQHSGEGGRGISVDGTLTIGTVDSSPTLAVTTTGAEISLDGDEATEAKTIKADGQVTIINGDITISSADDGIKSKVGIEINGGLIDIGNSIEGIEAPIIIVNDGEIHIDSSDDCLNATHGGGSESDDGSILTINGGDIALSAPSGDGIDSNGNLTIAGGTVIVHGPPNQPDLGVDVNGDFVITGGYVVVAQINSNMVETPSSSTNQNTILLSGNSNSHPQRDPSGGGQGSSSTLSAGTLFHIEDTSGNSLLTFAPKYNYSSILFSSSDLKNESSYRVYTGGTCTGTEKDGLYDGGTYSEGTLRTTFTSSGTVQTLNF